MISAQIGTEPFFSKPTGIPAGASVDMLLLLADVIGFKVEWYFAKTYGGYNKETKRYHGMVGKVWECGSRPSCPIGKERD